MSMLHNIYLICGRSGSGKTSIVDALSEKYGYKVLQSYTTRKPRHPQDTDHTYAEISDYMKAKTEGNIIASTVFDHNYYWSTTEQIDTSDLYVIDKVGIETLCDTYKGDRQCVVIYIDTDYDTCIQRMRKRGDLSHKIQDRLKNDAKAFEGIEHVSDFIIDGNREFDLVFSTVADTIQMCEQVTADKAV